MENTKKKVGQFQAYELNGFRLHVYNSNDVMADTSFIIEGEKGSRSMRLNLASTSRLLASPSSPTSPTIIWVAATNCPSSCPKGCPLS